VRYTALAGCVLLFAACSTKEAPPAADTTAMAPAPEAAAPTPATPVSLASVAGVWNVNVKPEGRDSVATTYVLNTTDSTAWTFAFPKGKPIPMRVTGVRGDTVITETDWFDSSVRPGLKARSSSTSWLQNGKLVGKTVVHYQTTGADTVRTFDTEGTKK